MEEMRGARSASRDDARAGATVRVHRKPSKRATADDLVKKAADLAPKFEDDADEFAIALQQSPSLREVRFDLNTLSNHKQKNLLPQDDGKII